MEPTLCDACGQMIQAGAWPFCPHPVGQANGIITDDIPGGMTVENGFDEPRTFYSHSAHRAALAKEGLEIRAKWAGPNDKIMTNWAAAITPKTLDDARELLERGAQAVRAKKERWPRAGAEITVEIGEPFRMRDLE